MSIGNGYVGGVIMPAQVSGRTSAERGNQRKSDITGMEVWILALGGIFFSIASGIPQL
jgi:hypothetical protein